MWRRWRWRRGWCRYIGGLDAESGCGCGWVEDIVRSLAGAGVRSGDIHKSLAGAVEDVATANLCFLPLFISLIIISFCRMQLEESLSSAGAGIDLNCPYNASRQPRRVHLALQQAPLRPGRRRLVSLPISLLAAKSPRKSATTAFTDLAALHPPAPADRARGRGPVGRRAFGRCCACRIARLSVCTPQALRIMLALLQARPKCIFSSSRYSARMNSVRMTMSRCTLSTLDVTVLHNGLTKEGSPRLDITSYLYTIRVNDCLHKRI
ncbi:hypothetical protein B0H12DRAFT_495368 [Mycena haematopus]|nr:hypothetical protein B0H12DRAFT_495368 [Mycena haematopus]